MSRIFILVSISIAIILFSVFGLLINKNNTNRIIKEGNMEYEYYLDKTIYGTEVTTLIGKAINENEKNSIQKDEKNHYIENKSNSIKIQIKMGKMKKTYPMEEIYNNDITKFIQNFNLVQFKCTSIEYHKNTGRVRKLIFEEVEN